MEENDKDWRRLSQALFAGVPEKASPGFARRVMANLEPSREPVLPLSWLAPAFLAAAAALMIIASTPSASVSAEELILDEPALIMEVE